MSLLTIATRGYKDVLTDLVEGRRVNTRNKRIALNEYVEQDHPGLIQGGLFRKLVEYYIATNDVDIRIMIKQMMNKTHSIIADVLVDYPQIKWDDHQRQKFIYTLCLKEQHQQCLHVAMDGKVNPRERELLIDKAFENGSTVNVFLKNGIYNQDDIQLLQAKALQHADVALSYYNYFRKEITPQIRERLYRSMLKDSSVASTFVNRKRNKATDEEKHQLFMSLLDKPKYLMYHMQRHVPDLIKTPEQQRMFFQMHKDWLFKSHFRNDSTQLFTLFKDAIDDDAVKYILRILNRLRTNKLGLINGILRAHDNGQIQLSQQTFDELNTVWATETLMNQ